MQVDFLYQFWKLKRKANFNQPLVALKRDEVDNLAQQEQDVLYRRLKLFTHLRQDLERVSGNVSVWGNTGGNAAAAFYSERLTSCSPGSWFHHVEFVVGRKASS